MVDGLNWNCTCGEECKDVTEFVDHCILKHGAPPRPNYDDPETQDGE